ncbi:hypothetical protein [Heliobacterium chlorum]|uniref:hypothetical protein n=1 Tax=Heliobacterium chlorum TaxID=2698 RepID=UPI001FADE72B|nr:hypothetical protein [Heliobacterium chlorum]
MSRRHRHHQHHHCQSVAYSNPTTSAQPAQACPQLPGTLVRIFIPAGAVINLLNLIEVSSPSGICLVVRIPILGGNSTVSSVLDSIRQAGGTVEFMTE